MEFVDLKLSQILQDNITSLGYTKPTPIQEQSLPPILKGQDVAGLAQTGTGKTAAFLVPLIERILRTEAFIQNPGNEALQEFNERVIADWKPNQFFLVLLPTRELAEQVLENFTKLVNNMPIRGVSIYGGTGYEKQIDALKKGVQFIFATPGRLIDLYKEHLVDLKQARGVVFDEADRMFDMGFKDDMKYILQRLPNDRQFMVFSATLNLEVLNTAYQFGSNPVEINISRDQTSAENVKDYLFHVGEEEKPQHLLSLLKKYNPKQAIIFTNFKHNVERIAQFLSQNDFPAIAISSLLTQAQRTRVISQFKETNNINIMVATDIAARGLDIQGVDLVINFELPNDCETYVHRIGRTGRASSLGTALSLCCDKDVESLSRIEDYLKRKVDVQYLEDSELIKEFKEYKEQRDFRGSRERDGKFTKDGKGGRRDSRDQRYSGDRKGGGSSSQERNRYQGVKNKDQGKHQTENKNHSKFSKHSGEAKHYNKPNSTGSVGGTNSKPKVEGKYKVQQHGSSAKVRTHKVSGAQDRLNTRLTKSAGFGSKIVNFFQKLFK